MIPSNIRKPGAYTEIDSSGGNTSLPAFIQEMLIVGQRLKEPALSWVLSTAKTVGATIKPVTANGHWYVCVVAGTTSSTEPTWPTTGTVADGTVTWREYAQVSDIVAAGTTKRIYSSDEAARYWGIGSCMHRMAIAAFRQFPQVVLSGIAVDDAAGTTAAGTITVTGTATEKGALDCYIGLDKISVSWENAATATNIADAIVAEAAKNPSLPVFVTNVAGVITLTAKHAGTIGNVIGKYNTSATKHLPIVNVDGAGVSVAIVGFSGGATDPTLTSTFAAVAGKQWDIIAIPYKDTTAAGALSTHLGNVSDVINQRGGRGFVGVTSAYADATTLSAQNYQRVHVGWVRKCRMSSFEVAASFAAMVAGMSHPAIPLNCQELKGCDAPDVTDRISWSEANDSLWAGVTPFEVGSGEKVRCVRCITSYTKNDLGAADPQWLDTTKVAIIDYLRKAINTRHTSDFAGKVVKAVRADGDPDFVITPADVNSTNIDVCVRLERYGCLQNVKALSSRFAAVLDPDITGRINSDIPTQVVEGAHILANTIRIVS